MPVTDDRLAEEAAGWVARMQSADTSEAERAEFSRWLAQDPDHAEAYAEMNALWGELKDVRVAAPARRAGGRAARAAGAALLCLAALLAFFLMESGQFDRWRADYHTGVGEIRMIALGDGTRVHLNSDAAIAVDFSNGRRQVSLLRGEAFFDVAPDPLRPFSVQSRGLSAVALGTRYAVSREPLAERVIVDEGRVEVSGGGSSLTLGAGGVARFDAQGALQAASADAAAETAWRDGRLVFSGRPLREVLAVLQRYRHGRIVVLDDAAARREVSGIFDLADTDEALRVLETSLPVTVTRLTGLLTVIRSR